MKKIKVVALSVVVTLGVGISGCNDSNSDNNGDSSDSNGIITPSPITGESIQFNEVYTWANQDSVEVLDWIELYNSNDEDVDISGYIMFDSGGMEKSWAFPANTIITAKSVYTVETDKYEYYEDLTNHPAWGLSKGPDETLTLLLPDETIIDEVAIPSLKEDECYGRETNGADEWVIFANCTKNEDNEGELRQPITNDIGLYINEVFTNNQDDDDLYTDWNEELDFIELYNSSDTDISLCDGYSMVDDAKKTEYEFEFSTANDCIVPAKGFLVIQSNPDKWKYDDPDKYGSKPLDHFVFGLGKSGDWVFIHDADSQLVAEIEIPGIPKTYEEGGEKIMEFVRSYGRLTDGSEGLTWFASSGISPGESNDGKETDNEFPEGFPKLED